MKKLILILLIFGLFFVFVSEAKAEKRILPQAHLIKGSDPEVYVLENGLKRWIPSPEIFNKFNYRWESINNIDDVLLGYYPQGEDLSKYDDYPEGSLVKGSGPAVYLIELGKRRWIPSPLVFEKYGFLWHLVFHISDSDLNKIEKGSDISLYETDKHPETLILDGPQEGEILETAEITFKYSGANPLGEKSDLTFETFLKGEDNKWRRQYSDSETYELSEESKVYTFYVRAKNKEGYYDLTPAWRNFQVGVSPYYQKVEVKKVYPKEDDFKNDYLILRNTQKESIDVTGWRLVVDSNKATIIIPKAAQYLTYPYTDNPKTNIILGYGDELIISANKSPKQVDFRTNLCVGYLDGSSQFFPSLDKDCPLLSESKYDHLKKSCRDFIDRLGRCKTADYSDNYEVSSDSDCTTFLSDNFSYSACYRQHRQEVKFLGDQWRIFLNKSSDLFDNNEDKITLKDKNNFIVDEYSY